MKGIVLAGGTGSRLFPLTKVTNKHLLPVGSKPMIFHPIEKLVQAGIREIMIVTGIEHMGAVVSLLGSGKEFGAEFTYRVQEEAGGIAQALGLARQFCQNSKVAVVLGDNIFSGSLNRFVEAFSAKDQGACVLLKEVRDPSRFGVAELGANGQILSIEEKPKAPKSNYAVTGIYFYDAKVFDIIETLKPSGRGELEITDVNNQYLRQGTLSSFVLEGSWTDAGTFESLKKANEIALNG